MELEIQVNYLRDQLPSHEQASSMPVLERNGQFEF